MEKHLDYSKCLNNSLTAQDILFNGSFVTLNQVITVSNLSNYKSLVFEIRECDGTDSIYVYRPVILNSITGKKVRIIYDGSAAPTLTYDHCGLIVEFVSNTSLKLAGTSKGAYFTTVEISRIIGLKS